MSAKKQFSLNGNEMQQLSLTRQHADAIFSIALSAIAAGRLGYNVSHNTQFSLSKDFKTVEIWDNDALTPPEDGPAPGAGIKTA